MDEDELARSLIEAANRTADEKSESDGEQPIAETEDLAVLIRNEANRIRGDFTMATDAAERHVLQQRYEKLDGWMGALNAAGAVEDADRSAGLKRALRATVLDEFRRWRAEGAAHQRRLKEIDAQRKRLAELSKAGAGAAGQRRIKDEIDLLIANYASVNEAKIEALIDRWRRSGDPSYDPAVNIRLRNARRKSDNSKNAH